IVHFSSFIPSHLLLVFFFLKLRLLSGPPLFPYTTLFRSGPSWPCGSGLVDVERVAHAVPDEGEGDHDRVEDDGRPRDQVGMIQRSEEHTSELQSRFELVCRLLLEKKKTRIQRQQKN